MIVDCHTHLYDDQFEKDLSEVIERAKNAGVTKIISVSETIEDIQKNLEIKEKFPIVHVAAGLYPAQFDPDQANKIINFIKSKRDNFLAIGEVGLDFWVAKSVQERDIQKEIFQKFITLSLETDLPLNVHSRSAGRHVIEMLIGNNAKKVQLHAFDGKASSAQAAVEAGFYFSIPPSIVRSRQKQKLVKNLPLDCLLLETDSPVLGPNASVRNEPANIRYSISSIAAIKNISEEEVVEITSRNAFALYKFER